MRQPRRPSQVSLFVVLVWLIIAAASVRGQNAAMSPFASELRTYRLSTASATEAGRMLKELLGDNNASVQILADEPRSELLVSGPGSVHELAEQLVRQLNVPLADPPPAVPPLLLKSYYCDPQNMDQQLQMLRSRLSRTARISADRTGARLVIAASDADHEMASGLLSRVAMASPLFPEEVSGAHPGRSLQAEPWQAAGPQSGANHVLRYLFRHITAGQAETALQRLLGQRLLPLEPHRMSFSAGQRRTVDIAFDDLSRTCRLEGPRDLVLQFAAFFRQLDDAREKSADEEIRFVPLTNVNPETLNRAIQIWRRSTQPEKSATQGSQLPSSALPSGGSIRPVGFLQQAGEPAIPIEPSAAPTAPPGSAVPSQQTDERLRRPSSDVTVEPLPDLDVLIVRGRDPDVEELTRIIQEIERLSAETAPEIEVMYLKNVQGDALNELISDVLDDLTGPLQGRVSITPLVKPNALLLIGWGEAVAAARKLIERLDEAVPANTQMQVYSLKHAAATEVEATVREFLSNRGGLGPEVNITADPRTNAVIVNAAPRDMLEVARLIERLDAGTSASVNQARIIRLKNALAADVSQTITSAIQAARGGGTGQRTAALEMLMVGPDGNSVAASGLLDDVTLTPDPRTNRIFVTGPADSLPLVEQLIQSLDESPAASALIKVFHITNGDASDLVLVLRSLFPEQAATSTVPQLATAEGESSLVPVRFSVDIRTNSIIATGTDGDLRIIEALLLRLDETDTQERINQVYKLKNSPALDVANAVNNFLRSERIVNLAAPGRQNPFTQIESEVVVVPEPVGNALIISATPRYFDQIVELVEGLDAQPPQVMIQVILAEVELDNLHEFGVELGLQDSLLFDRSLLGSLLTPGFDFNNNPLGNANNPASLATRGNVGGQALSHFSVGRRNADADFGGLVLSASSENVSVLLRALDQTRNMEVLSRPQVMTLDNQPAFIQVGQRVPRIVGTSINQVGQVNSIELENVGLILGVTPRISPEGMVVMEIDAEKSEVGPDIDGIPVSISAEGRVIRSPRINITTAQTTVSAASGQTIVIGGLITTNNSSISRRVPWLSDVPVVGNLFRFDGTKSNRKELLIILTPHVVRGPSEAEYLKQVELARMSWISCDMFSWMNTESPISGQLDGTGIPTFFPDQSPGIESLKPMSPGRSANDGSPPAPPDPGTGFEPETAPPATSQARRPPATKVVVPDWTIDSVDPEDEDQGVRQISMTPSQNRKSSPSRSSDDSSSDSRSSLQPRPDRSEKTPRADSEQSVIKSASKPFWSLR